MAVGLLITGPLCQMRSDVKCYGDIPDMRGNLYPAQCVYHQLGGDPVVRSPVGLSLSGVAAVAMTHLVGGNHPSYVAPMLWGCISAVILSAG